MRFAIFVAIPALLAVGCFHQAKPDDASVPGLEKSVFPVQVKTGFAESAPVDAPDFRLAIETGESAGRPETLGENLVYLPEGQTVAGRSYRFPTPAHRACAGFYAAPNLLVTSVAAFTGDPLADNSAFDLNGVLIRDGSYVRRAAGIPLFDPVFGLVIIRTEEAGVPLKLRAAPVRAGSEAVAVGFTFRVSDTVGGLAIPSWHTIKTAVSPQSMELGGRQMGRLTSGAPAGMCGAPVLDSDGSVIGMLNGGTDTFMRFLP